MRFFRIWLAAALLVVKLVQPQSETTVGMTSETITSFECPPAFTHTEVVATAYVTTTIYPSSATPSSPSSTAKLTQKREVVEVWTILSSSKTTALEDTAIQNIGDGLIIPKRHTTFVLGNREVCTEPFVWKKVTYTSTVTHYFPTSHRSNSTSKHSTGSSSGTSEKNGTESHETGIKSPSTSGTHSNSTFASHSASSSKLSSSPEPPSHPTSSAARPGSTSATLTTTPVGSTAETSSAPAVNQTSSTFIPTALTSQWASEMENVTCSPPCILTPATLTLENLQTVSFWNFTASFCSEIDGVTYISPTVAQGPILTKSELGFYPLNIPAKIKDGERLVPAYLPSVTSQPPFKINVAARASLCPAPLREVSENGTCGAQTELQCPDYRCCGSDNTCGTDKQHCWEGCQQDWGSCWKSEDVNVLPVTEVFGAPGSGPSGYVYPPDNGRGVLFGGWQFCWNCDVDGHHWFIAPIPIPIYVPPVVVGEPDIPTPSFTRQTEPSESSAPTSTRSKSSSSDECITLTLSGYTASCFRQNASTIGRSTITGYSTCTGTQFVETTGCFGSIEQPPSTTVWEEGPSCPLNVDVSPDDSQGEEGVPTNSTTPVEACPYVGNITMSIGDDQGEDGNTTVQACELIGNVTVTKVVMFCSQMNNTASTPTATSCFNSTTFNVTGTCITPTTSTSIIPACPWSPQVTISPDDDQGEDGSPACTSNKTMTADLIVSLCFLSNFTTTKSVSESVSATPVCTANTTVKTTGTCLSPTMTSTSIDYCPYRADVSIAPIILTTTYGSMTAPPSYTLGYSTPGFSLWCPKNHSQPYCKWISPTSTSTSPIPTSDLSAWSSRIAEAAKSLEDKINEAEIIESSVSSVIKESSELSSMLSMARSTITAGFKHTYSTCYGTCTVPSISLPSSVGWNGDWLGTCQQMATDNLSPYCKCRTGGRGYTTLPMYTVCGYLVCPNQIDQFGETWCPPSTGGSRSPPVLTSISGTSGIGGCTFTYSGQRLRHSSCMCDVEGQTTQIQVPFATTSVIYNAITAGNLNTWITTLVQVCPNQVAWVSGTPGVHGWSWVGSGKGLRTQAGITTSWWANQTTAPSLTCLYTTPSAYSVGDCTRQFDKNGMPTRCLCKSPSWRDTGMAYLATASLTCGTFVCPNEIFDNAPCAFRTPTTTGFASCTQLSLAWTVDGFGPIVTYNPWIPMVKYTYTGLSCACEGQPPDQTHITPTTYCGTPVCPNEVTCLPPYSSGLGQCTREIHYSTNKGKAVTSTTCHCEGGPNTIKMTSACGTSYCPNEAAIVDYPESLGGPSIISSVQYFTPPCGPPRSSGIGECTLQIFVNAPGGTWASCDCESTVSGVSAPEPTAVCSTTMCPNQVYSTTLTNTLPDSIIISGTTRCSRPTATDWGSCRPISFLYNGTSTVNCNCATLSGIGYANPLPVATMVCGSLMCANSEPGPQIVVQTKDRVKNGTKTLTVSDIKRDAAFEAARKGVRDYYAKTTTKPATPGSTPKPAPRDTSTPAEPTALPSVAQASTELDGWNIAVHQEHLRTMTDSSQPSKTKSGASKVMEKLLSYF